MIYKAVLKKSWTSPRGRLYPEGTVFLFNKKFEDTGLILYNFEIPGHSHGFVVLSNNIFRKLTELEKHLRRLRDEEREEHLRNCEDPYTLQ